MKNLGLFIIGMVLLFKNFTVFADSPITSTYWADSYKNVPIIAEVMKKTQSGNQILTQKEFDFLVNSKNTVAERLSLINANGWNIDGLSNAPGLLKTFITKYKVSNEEQFLAKANSHDLIIYAYCLAMDNYFDVNTAHDIAFMAYEKNNEKEKDFSYAVNLVYAIIACQTYLDDMGLWCNVYKTANTVKTSYDNGKLKKDFKDEAAKSIYEYLFIYKDSCN